MMRGDRNAFNFARVSHEDCSVEELTKYTSSRAYMAPFFSFATDRALSFNVVDKIKQINLE